MLLVSKTNDIPSKSKESVRFYITTDPMILKSAKFFALAVRDL
jgi:hypothetical protein